MFCCFLFNIQFWWYINLIRYIFAVFLTLAYTFCQQIFYLPVDAAKIILGPCGYSIIQLRRYPQGYLLFFLIICHNLSIQAAPVDNRLGIMVAGAVLFVSILLYNIAIRFLPWLIGRLGNLLGWICGKIKTLFYVVRRECYKL